MKKFARATALVGLLYSLSLPLTADDYSEFVAPQKVEVSAPDILPIFRPFINFSRLELVIREPDRKTEIARFRFEGKDGDFYTAVREVPKGYYYSPGSLLVVPRINIQILHLPFWMDWDFGDFRMDLNYRIGNRLVTANYKATGRAPDGSYDATLAD